MSVSENLLKIKSGLPSQVSLVAVSKYKSNDLIQAAYNAGQRDFGENYVQELLDKQIALPADIRWHFIGHLQSNKVKYIVPFVYLIHGVDSVKLLAEINKQANKINIVVNCLLQVYIAKEESKFGMDFKEVEDLLSSEAFSKMQNIKICGLMGMATNTINEEVLKKEFLSLSNFSKQLNSSFGIKSNLEIKTISMGMSSDYPLAITCGSNMVRIGSSIFGERVKTG